jgi:hypothetical protein
MAATSLAAASGSGESIVLQRARRPELGTGRRESVAGAHVAGHIVRKSPA